MSEHFIKNIEIKNFKCFKDFKADGFGRVNLIGGKNNVGKTAFMEACLLHGSISFNSIERVLSSFITIESARNKIDKINKEYMTQLLKKFKHVQIYGKSGGYIKFIEQPLALYMEYKDEKGNISNTNKLDSLHNVGLLWSNFNTPCDKGVSQLFNEAKKNRKIKNINEFISGFEVDAEEIDLIDEQFQIFSKNRKEWVPLSDYGDGLYRYFIVLLVLYGHQNMPIFLDELENGIHYTNLDKLWEIILTVSKDQNVQVFATTHSKECIESYARVAKKLGDEDVKFLSLYKNRTDELKSITLNYQDIQDRIELGLDNR